MKRSVSILAFNAQSGSSYRLRIPIIAQKSAKLDCSFMGQVDLDSQAIRQGVNLDRLSPTELVLLQGDVRSLLGALPEDAQIAARDAASAGSICSKQVLVDCTEGILTAVDGSTQGFVDLGGQMTQVEAFSGAGTKPRY